MKSRIRSLASDTMIYGIFTIVGRFVTFMLTPLYTNYLTIKEVGDITYLFSIIAFLNIIFSFGLDSAFFRFFKKDDHEHNKKVFSHSYIGIALLSLIITTITIFFSRPIAGSLIDMKDGYILIILGAFIDGK